MRTEALLLGAALLSLVLLAGCFTPVGDKEQLLSYLPDEDITGIAYVTVSADGISEIRGQIGLLSSSVPGGSLIRDIDAFEGAIAVYEGKETVLVGLVETDASLEDVLDGYSELSSGSYYSSRSAPEIDEEEINGRKVYAVYSSYDSQKENPVCVWEESFGFGVMAVNNDWRGSYKKDCLYVLDRMKEGYANENANSLLEKSNGRMGKISSLGTELAVIKGANETVSVAGKVYGDNDAVYALAVGELKGLGDMGMLGLSYSGSGRYGEMNLCYGGYSENATIVEKDSKYACRKESRSVARGLTLERRASNGNGVMGLAFVKGGSRAAERAGEILEEAVFAVDLDAGDEKWRQTLDVTLTTYVVGTGSERKVVDYDYYEPMPPRARGDPLQGVKAELYVREEGSGNMNSDYVGGAEMVARMPPYYQSRDVLRETKYTGVDGKVTFKNVPLTNARIVLSKQGYEPEYAYSDNHTVYVNQYMQDKFYFVKATEKNLTVNVYAIPDTSSYLKKKALAGAKVELYKSKYRNTYNEEEPLEVKYTDSYGEVVFENVSKSGGRVEVSKPGYEATNGKDFYVSSFSRYSTTITAYLVGKGGEVGEQYVIIPDSDDFNLEEFEIEAWVKPYSRLSDTPRGYQTIVSKWNQYTLRFFGTHSGKDHGLQAQYFTTSNMPDENAMAVSVYEAEGDWKADTWYHVAFRYDGKEMTVFRNGEIIGKKDTTKKPRYSDYALLIGDHHGEPDIPTTTRFIGTIDEVKLWDLRGTKELVAHYAFEGNSSTIEDSSGNHHNGIVFGAIRTSNGKSGKGMMFTE